ncbi:GNAT family N-acetyltransferase [Arthrobacter frigidicola]|nr:GNAT family N-acetyltransferase [Arthrobacter frigidicola]
MLIRRAEPADAPEAIRVFRDSRTAAAVYLPSAAHTAAEDEEFVRGVLISERQTWLAVDGDGQAAGLLSLSPGWIDQLYVAPEYWGRGVGTLLLGHAKALQPSGLQLWTFESNLGAQRFYKRHGFVAVERTDGAENEERAPDIRYAWSGS